MNWYRNPTECEFNYLFSKTSLTPVVFNISEPVNAKACSGIFGSCDRPKVIYNEKTSKYVLMAFAGMYPHRSPSLSVCYSLRRAAPGAEPGIPVFTSDYLTHGYTFQGHLIQKTWWYGQGVEDLSLAVIDGEGYVIYTTWDMISAIVTDGNLGSVGPFLSQLWTQLIIYRYGRRSARLW